MMRLEKLITASSTREDVKGQLTSWPSTVSINAEEQRLLTRSVKCTAALVVI